MPPEQPVGSIPFQIFPHQLGEGQRPPPGVLPDIRKDRTRERLLSLRWAFARQASLDLTWQDSRRQSNVPSWRYRSDLLRVGISGRF